MSPVPSLGRLSEYATKGAHLGLRQVAMAPEQRRARRLAADASQTFAPNATKVTFLTPRDWAAHVQWEGIMAQALRVRGAAVSFITCGGGLELCDRVNTYEGPPVPCRTCRHYVESSIAAHGFPRRSMRDGWEDSTLADWPELDAMELDELFAVVDDGIPLGRCIEIPVRWFLMRSVIEEDPLAPITARRFLRSGRRVVAGLRAALLAQQPDVLVVLNGLFFFESIALEVARQLGIRTLCYERGFITETILLHSRRPDLLLDVSDLWEAAKSRPLGPDEEHRLDAYLSDRRFGRRTIDRYWGRDTKQRLGDSWSAGRRVTLFTNLTWDAAVIGQEIAFPGIHDWLDTAIGWFSIRPEHLLRIRIHPAERRLAGKETREPLGKWVLDRYPDLPSNIQVIDPLDPISSYALMEDSDFGLVYTSTTGLELALNGTPVVVAGNTHYRGKGFTVDVSSPEEFRTALGELIADPSARQPDRELARRYANLFFFDSPITLPGVEEHVPGLARLTITDLSELAPGRSADLDRLCDLILRRGT